MKMDEKQRTNYEKLRKLEKLMKNKKKLWKTIEQLLKTDEKLWKTEKLQCVRGLLHTEVYLTEA